MIIRFSSLVLLSALFVGCTSAEVREDRAVLEAIYRLRDSSSDDLSTRHTLIDTLAKLPASSSRAREARDACADAYRLMAEGKEATLKIKSDLERLGAAPKNALEDLAVAEEKLKKSETGMLACQKAAAELSLARR